MAAIFIQKNSENSRFWPFFIQKWPKRAPRNEKFQNIIFPCQPANHYASNEPSTTIRGWIFINIFNLFPLFAILSTRCIAVGAHLGKGLVKKKGLVVTLWKYKILKVLSPYFSKIIYFNMLELALFEIFHQLRAIMSIKDAKFKAKSWFFRGTTC